MKESTYNRTRAYYFSMGHEDQANLIDEILTEKLYDEVGIRVLAHVLGDEAKEAIQKAAWLQDNGRTAHDGINARMMSLGEIMREAAQRGAA